MTRRDESETLRWSRQRVLESLDDAATMLDLFEYERMRVAELKSGNPDADPDVIDAKVKLHVSVMRLFRRLRAQIKDNLSPTYWKNAPIYSDGDRYIVGIKELERFQSHVYKTTRQKRDTAVSETTEEWGATLLPPQAYKRAINLFGECAEKLGYTDPPNEIEPVYDMQAYPEGYTPPADWSPEDGVDVDLDPDEIEHPAEGVASGD